MSLGSVEFLYSLAVPGVQALKPYEPGKPLEELEREFGITEAVKLASNENPLGMSPYATQAIEAGLTNASLYPDGNAFYLKQALASFLSNDSLKVSEDQITVGNGSNDVLEIIARCFVTAHDAIMYSQHAFAVYPIVTQAIGATHQKVPALDWGHDLDAMAEAINNDTKLIFIANPNNPTGTFLKSSGLKSFLKNLPENILVVVDEAYHEYVNREDYESALNWMDQFPNLIICRTFSKSYGLAGLRVGYCVSHPEITNILNRVRQPFNVNNLALIAAQAALSDQSFIHDSVALNQVGKQKLYNAFDEMGLDYIISEGNFVALDVKQDVETVNLALLKKGVIIRPIAAYEMPTFIRVSVGNEAEINRFISALSEVLEESGSTL